MDLAKAEIAVVAGRAGMVAAEAKEQAEEAEEAVVIADKVAAAVAAVATKAVKAVATTTAASLTDAKGTADNPIDARETAAEDTSIANAHPWSMRPRGSLAA